MKKVVFIILTLLLIVGGFFTYHSISRSTLETNALSIIPNNAIYLLETKDPIKNWNTFSQSSFWNFISRHPSMAELATDANYLDSIYNDNSFLLDYLGERSFYLSAHMINSRDYDFLILIDLKNQNNPELINKIIQSLTDKSAYTTRIDEYKDVDVLSVYSKADRDELFIASIGGFLAFSYTDDIVLNSIDKYLSDNDEEPRFTKITTHVDKDELARFYLNYQYLDKYIGVYIEINKELVQTINQEFSYSGFDIDLDDEQISLSGKTIVQDSLLNYSQLLMKYGQSSFDFESIISNRTAFLIAFGIEDFPSFYEELIALRNSDANDLQDYNQLKNKVEKILGLSLEQDILPWIGEEIVLAQHRPSKLHRQSDDILVSVKAHNIAFAKEKLQLIQKAIKRRTPAKFKKLKYKTYDIYYLDIKNFFSVFFGKAFDKVDRPYYTILEDKIIFSNDPKTIIATIEDYENKRVLSEDENFEKVKDNLPSSSAIFTYVNGYSAYEAMKPKVRSAERTDYYKNKPYFTFIDAIGISHSSIGLGFDTDIIVTYSEGNKTEPISINLDELAEDYLVDYAGDLANLTEAETFVLNEINDGDFIKYYKGTNKVQIKAETKKGLFHGDFREYYLSGELKSKGGYKKGKKSGRWKYYDEDGEVIEKSWEGW